MRQSSAVSIAPGISGGASTPSVVIAAENRRLKLLGLGLLIPCGGALAWAVNQITATSTLNVEALLKIVASGIVVANGAAIGGIVLRAAFGGPRKYGDRRWRRAVTLQLFAANLVAPGLIWSLLIDDPGFNARVESAGWIGWPEMLSLALAVVGWRVWRRSRRHETISADEAMALDPRPPVLYLRSFRDDGETFVDDAYGGGAWLLRAMRLGSAEEKMVPILSQLGPVIAIGKPGEPLPELGAARLYVDHRDWQQRVLELMQQASLVVVRVGASPGVLWEIDQALSVVPPHRLVLTILSSSVAPELVGRLAPRFGSTLDGALPEARERSWRAKIWPSGSRRIGGLLCFTEQGVARVVAVQRDVVPRLDLRQMMTGFDLRPLIAAIDVRRIFGRMTAKGALEQAWDEVLREIGLAPAAPLTRRSRVVAVLLAILFGAFAAHWFYLGNRRRAWMHLAAFPLLMASLFLGFIDALRFVLVDRAEFDSRFARPGSDRQEAPQERLAS